MLKECLERALKFYNSFDCLIIVNKNGIVEYSTMYSSDKNFFINEEVSGMHILDVYPSLTEETSSILRTLRTGKENLNERQTATNFRGKSFEFLNSDFPIIVNGETIGVVEVSVYLDNNKSVKKIESTNKSKYPHNLFSLDDIVTKDKYFMSLKEKISMISKTDSSVLIYGETGTGKDMVAQSIHSHSNRWLKPFVSQNCAAIPSTLLESTFFGTIKGAYTGAENRLGLFEVADGGTLFLDEINSMDIGLQAKILKAIEEKRIKRVGGTEEIVTNVRIVSAINISPEVAIKEGKLREDLFYRLSVVQLNLPPLRERKQDIELLSEHFLEKYNREMGKNITGIGELAKDILRNYDWPGNVRELQNVIESAFNVAQGDILKVQDIPEYVFNQSKDKLDMQRDISKNNGEASLQELLESYEKNLIYKAITSSKNYAQAARKLKISCQSLQYKMRKYNLN